MPLPVLVALAAKVAAPVVIAGAGKLFYDHKKKAFEADPKNKGKQYGVGKFVSESTSDLRNYAQEQSGKMQKSYDSAYKSSSGYSDSELRDKYSNSSGAEKAGYGHALKERMEDS